MDADIRRPGGGGRLNPDNYGGRGVKNWQNLADVFYGWPPIDYKQLWNLKGNHS